MQAQRERPRMLRELIACGDLAELRLGLQRAHIAAAFDLAAFEEVAVAREDDAALLLRDAADLGIGERLVVSRVEAEHPQEARQCAEVCIGEEKRCRAL